MTREGDDGKVGLAWRKGLGIIQHLTIISSLLFFAILSKGNYYIWIVGWLYDLVREISSEGLSFFFFQKKKFKPGSQNRSMADRHVLCVIIIK